MKNMEKLSFKIKPNAKRILNYFSRNIKRGEKNKSHYCTTSGSQRIASTIYIVIIRETLTRAIVKMLNLE